MKRIEILKGIYALVDDVDFLMVKQYKWSITRTGQTVYALAHVKKDGKNTSILMHRLILNAPKGKHVDHINHNGLDNRRFNLRIATSQQNCFNSTVDRPRRSNYKGVQKSGNKWSASITKNGKNYRLGSFDSEVSAAYAYDCAADRLFGEFACKNFPDGKVPTFIEKPYCPKFPKKRASHLDNKLKKLGFL